MGGNIRKNNFGNMRPAKIQICLFDQNLQWPHFDLDSKDAYLVTRSTKVLIRRHRSAG